MLVLADPHVWQSNMDPPARLLATSSLKNEYAGKVPKEYNDIAVEFKVSGITLCARGSYEPLFLENHGNLA